MLPRLFVVLAPSEFVIPMNKRESMPTCVKVQPDGDHMVSEPYILVSAVVLFMDNSIPWYYSGYVATGLFLAYGCTGQTMTEL